MEYEIKNTLMHAITPLVSPLGYEVIHIEVQPHHQKVLRIYIDHKEGGKEDKKNIGIDDCVRVSKILDEPLDALPELATFFRGSYELEVSSPGIKRPLSRKCDFERFGGEEARIHVIRPLTTDEISNQEYLARNPKQKNFSGKLAGVKDDKVLMLVINSERGGKHKAEDTVAIPLSLISKACLESKERERVK
ncbi:MAG: ribosome maturation factor RimP [Bdellovibrionota bacterium]